MITVLYHNDADGFGAAYAAWAKLPRSTTFIPVQYGEPVPEIPEGTSQIYILDFSYDRTTCEALAEKFNVVILDHHKTAQAALEGLPYATFDMNKSGCRLAWEYFWPGAPIPALLAYVEDRDLWRWALPQSEEANLFIATLPFEFMAWLEDIDLDQGCFAIGAAIKSFRDGQIKSSLKNVRMMRWMLDDQTYDVPVANASANISELGNEMCVAYPDAPFSASYCDRKDCRSWSLRSVGDFDVSAIAKAFGGGGHRNAAGFTTTLHTEPFLKAFEEA